MGFSRIIAVRPDSLAQLREMVVSELRGVLLLLTKCEVGQYEDVLLDVRLPEMGDSWLLRARASFTLPEGRGPFFAVAREDLPRLHHILAGEGGSTARTARTASRYPVSLDARIALPSGKSVYAQITDLSLSGARLAVLGLATDELTVGGAVSIELSRPSCGLPERFMAEVRVDRGGVYGLRFASDDEGRRAVRRFLHQAESTGQLPHLE